MVRVNEWAEIRRLHFVTGLGIREIARRTGLARHTVRRALRSEDPPRYTRPARAPKLEPYKPEIHRLLAAEPALTAVRVGELIGPLGYSGGQTQLNVYVREVRPLFSPPPRTFQRTVYQPGEICQFDLWHPRRPIPVGHGQSRRGFVVVACLGYSRAGAGALVFSARAADLLWGMSRCLWRLGGLPATLVWDRQGALHAGAGRATEALAAYCGRLRVGWHFCQAADPQAKGAVERLQGYLRTSFEPGRMFANELDYADQLDAWFERANARIHRALRCRPAERLEAERAAMAPLPGDDPPDTDERLVLRVAPQPFVRVDTCDYSLDPRLVGRRVEVRVGQRQITGVALDTGEPACSHPRSFARHRTVLDGAHLGTGRPPRAEPEVERRLLAGYDALIPA